MQPTGPSRVVVVVGLVVVAAIIVVGLLGTLLRGDRASFDSKLLSLLIVVGALAVLSPLVWLAVRFAYRLPRSAIYRVLRMKFPLAKIGRISAIVDSGGLDFGEGFESPPLGFLVFDSDGLSVWSGQVDGGLLVEEHWSSVTWLDAGSQPRDDVIGMNLAGRTLVVSLEIRKGGSWVPITSPWVAAVRASHFGKSA
jgi:hypothetical protein